MIVSSRPRTEELGPIPENLFREPIDFLCADHFRRRVICEFIDEIALDPNGLDVARLSSAALDYFEQELPLHLADEEQDLFALLRERCGPEDRLDAILSMLLEEHVRGREQSSLLSAGLRRLAAGGPLPQTDEFLHVAPAFAEGQRRHLAWEEAVLFPLARTRLSQADLDGMGRSMAARRNVAYPA
jgi:hypothetical protein